MSTSKSRGYILTINNPTVEDEESLIQDDHSYCCYQFEKGEEGTEHIQAFIYYKNPRVFPKRKYPRAHIEAAKSISASMNYCKKEDTRIRGPYILGEEPQQGRRTDLESLANKIKDGASMYDLAVENPEAVIRYHRGLQVLKQLYNKDRTDKPTVIWKYGKTGVGKTRSVYEKHPSNVYMKDGTQWWDGYYGQEAILIDDFDGKWPFRDLLRLLDYNPYQGQTKGGYVKINSPFIYITCEFHPREIYGGFEENHLDQVLRRINKIELLEIVDK